jgi:hypothetical protein
LRHQFGHRLRRIGGVDDEHVGHQRDRRDRREVLLEVVGQLLVDAGRDRVVHRADQQRVAVGFGLRDVVGAERRARPGLAFDDHRLAEARLQLVGQRARQHVGGAAGRERHDQRDRLVGPRLGERTAGGQGGGERQVLEAALHLKPPCGRPGP